MSEEGGIAVITVDFEIPIHCKYLWLRDKKAFERRMEEFSRQYRTLLEFLEEEDVSATFFVEGLLAVVKPELVLELRSREHEIACHAFFHWPLTWMRSEAEIEQEVTRALKAIKELTADDPLGFRAPRFMVSDTVLRVLERLGFVYDSSIVPSWCPGQYRNLDKPCKPYFPIPHREMLELPVSVIRKLRIPLGLPWMNALGKRAFLTAMKLLGVSQPLVFYLHVHDVASRGLENLRSLMKFLKTQSYDFRRALDLVKELMRSLREKGDGPEHNNGR